jgi:hypothetical protein
MQPPRANVIVSTVQERSTRLAYVMSTLKHSPLVRAHVIKVEILQYDADAGQEGSGTFEL